MSVTLGRLEQVPPRTLWESEARDFTPWLAENLGLLGEALGLDLELVQTEVAVGSFSCDIECREQGTGRKVIVENQLEQTDHSHLGQLLTYAAGLDAAVVVWISPEVRDEHREAIDWLNRHTRETVDFFAAALEVVRIGNSDPAVIFRLAASPNAWAKTAAAGASRGETSSRMASYQAFWQPLLDELREKHRFTNAKAAQPQSWYSFASGVASGITYGVAFARGDRLQAEVYIDVGDAPRNKAIFDFFLAEKIELEAAMGEPLSWERLDAKRACRIAVVRPATTIDDAPEQGDEMRTWLVTRLLKLKQVFGPRVKMALQVAVNPPPE
ncbi:DUF4268 domain-containing protein [Magnetospirillum sp. SS-4]|uniref:DUF4268 domain-containing protein n=1 Tax=Magnetospirillum sp. SS-4 TaxID=2681465 RepID=UPI001380EBB1|nr:DUF4268 domain-containing protein [Magnetospirillum sp. SS-4]CAA7614905.1 conserved hypothetical protein [Magnetospirillum sp. SS-4]